MNDGWVRNATITRVVDGDTVVADIDLGYRVHVREYLRLHGINAPEKRGETKAAGERSMNHLIELLAEHGGKLCRVVIKSHKNKAGKYGRWIAEIIAGDININQQMIDDGHAVEYP